MQQPLAVFGNDAFGLAIVQFLRFHAGTIADHNGQAVIPGALLPFPVRGALARPPGGRGYIQLRALSLEDLPHIVFVGVGANQDAHFDPIAVDRCHYFAASGPAFGPAQGFDFPVLADNFPLPVEDKDGVEQLAGLGIPLRMGKKDGNAQLAHQAAVAGHPFVRLRPDPVHANARRKDIAGDAQFRSNNPLGAGRGGPAGSPLDQSPIAGHIAGNRGQVQQGNAQFIHQCTPRQCRIAVVHYSAGN